MLRTAGIIGCLLCVFGCSTDPNESTGLLAEFDRFTPVEANCLIGADWEGMGCGSYCEPTVVYNEAECIITFTWLTTPYGQPGTTEVLWGPHTASCNSLPNQTVNGAYTYSHQLVLDVRNIPYARIKYKVRSTAECGSYYYMPLVAGPPQYGYCKVIVIDPYCQPQIPCEEPC